MIVKLRPDKTDLVSSLVEEITAKILMQEQNTGWSVWTCPHCGMKNLLTFDDGRAYTTHCMACNGKTKVYRTSFKHKRKL